MASRLLYVKQFCVLYACGRTKAYELMATGKIEAVKIGGATRILTESAERWASQLPKKPAK